MLNASCRSFKPSPRFGFGPNFTTLCGYLSSVSTDDDLLDFFDHLLRHCRSSARTRQIHGQILVNGSHRSSFLVARLVSSYARFGHVESARDVFDEMPIDCKSSLLLCNSIIRAYVTNGYCLEALNLYCQMRRIGVLGDGFTFPLVIRACGMPCGLNFYWGRILHCQSLQMGLDCNLHVGNELVGMYGRLGWMDVAQRLFDRLPRKSQISWNTLISGFSRNFDSDSAVEMVRLMELEGLEPNLVTWTSLLSSHLRCGKKEEAVSLFREMRRRGVSCSPEVLAVMLSVLADGSVSDKGRTLHGLAVQSGCIDHLIVRNALVALYGKQGDIEDAKKIFSETETRNIVTWNSLITSYVDCGSCDEAYEVFSQLEELGCNCSMMKPNVVSWSAVIDGFASTGRGKEALELFRRMQYASAKPNYVTICSVLSVCADLAALNSGREIHARLLRVALENNVVVGNSLISMYMKSGILREGVLVFEMLNSIRDLISWNSIIAGFGMHGHGRESLEYFDQMLENGFRPDKVTFTAVLSACSHSGLVNEGRDFFKRMSSEFGVEPRMEHYACVVDLLSRFGSLREAIDIVKTMPFEPDAFIWSALLNSCQMHRDTAIAEETAAKIYSIDSDVTGSYTLLSNIYALKGRWEDSARVRVSAREKGLKKVAGLSWIELKQKVYTFSAGNAISVDLDMEETYRVLKELKLQMDKPKLYVPISDEREILLD